MDRRTLISFSSIIMIVLLGALVVTACGGDQEQSVSPASEQESIAPATLDGQTLVGESCTKCHDLARTTNSRKTEDEWQATVERMVSKGADLNPAEQEAVIQYLAETYPK